jgi:coenzyme F420-reducing hydrogenase beta subunit
MKVGDIDDHLGPYRSIWAGYSLDEDAPERVASGGLATTLLGVALANDIVDGVAISRPIFDGRGNGYRFDIVTSSEEIARYGKSYYANIPIERHLKELDSFSGRLALSCLPCHARAVRALQSRGRLTHIVLLLSLFCGHNNEPDLWELVLAKKGVHLANVRGIRVDRSYLGGGITIDLQDGRTLQIPFRHFNVYRSLWFFSKDLCRYCDEHLGAEADLSIGDIFIQKFRSRAIKHSAMVVRSELAERLVQLACDRRYVYLEPVSPDELFSAQRRILAPSKDSLSRYYANRLFGYRSKKPEKGRFRMRSFITYSLLIANNRLSWTKFGRWLLHKIPSQVLYPYAACIKLINHTLRP